MEAGLNLEKLQNTIAELKETVDTVERLVKVFSKVLNKVNPDDFISTLKLSSTDWELVLSFFQENEVEGIEELMDVGMAMVESIREVELAHDEKNIVGVATSDNQLLKEFLTLAQEVIKEIYPQLLEDYNNLVETYRCCHETQKQLASPVIYVKPDFIDWIDHVKRKYKKAVSALIAMLINYIDLLNEEKKEELAKLPTEEEKEETFKKQLLDRYHLEDNNLSVTDILEVLNASKKVGPHLLQSHQEVFSSFKESYLQNLSLLEKANVFFPLLVMQDPEALFLDPKELAEKICFIQQYGVSVNEMLQVQKEALTDQSYFQMLDHMIEHQCFSLSYLQEPGYWSIKKKIALDLLGVSMKVPAMRAFPLTKEQIDFLLEKNQGRKEEGEVLVLALELDQIDDLTYQCGDILLSRPKVLRQECETVLVDTLLEDSYLREEDYQKAAIYLKAKKK